MAATPAKFSLFKRSNGFYYVVYDQDDRRRWKSTGAKTRSEALKALADLETLLRPSHRTLSYAQFLKEFMSYANVHNAARTVALFRNVLNGFNRVVKNTLITDITAVHIDRYKTMRLREVKPVSVNVELRMLKSAFSTALRWKMIKENPCKGVPFAHVPEQLPIFLTPIECGYCGYWNQLRVSHVGGEHTDDEKIFLPIQGTPLGRVPAPATPANGQFESNSAGTPRGAGRIIFFLFGSHTRPQVFR